MQIIIMRCKYDLYENESKINKILKRIKQDSFLNKIAVVTLAFSMYIEKIALASDGIEKINVLGLRFLGIIQSIGYWVCIIMCLVDILKCVGCGDYKKVGSIIAKYLLIMAALYGIKWAFDMVKDAFI